MPTYSTSFISNAQIRLIAYLCLLQVFSNAKLGKYVPFRFSLSSLQRRLFRFRYEESAAPCALYIGYMLYV